MTEFVGTPDMTNRHVAIVVSRFNESVTMRLLEGAIDALERHGGNRADIDVMWVPGAWELPAGARALLATERYDAIVALGAVIRGETPHFDFVAGEASRGLAAASAEFDVPIGFGLLTTDTLELLTRPHVPRVQCLERSRSRPCLKLRAHAAFRRVPPSRPQRALHPTPCCRARRRREHPPVRACPW